MNVCFLFERNTDSYKFIFDSRLIITHTYFLFFKRSAMSRLHCIFNTFTRYFPRISVSLLILWSCWSIIFRILTYIPGFEKISILTLEIITIIPAVLSLWSYFTVLQQGPGSPLDIPLLVVYDYIEDANGNPVGSYSPPEEFVSSSIQCKKDGGFRFCSKCKCWKPDRSHHCSGCQKCVLKMDHHCPWFGDCIGFRNYRYFIHFLAWTNVYLFVITCIAAYTLWQLFVYDSWSIDYFSLHQLFVFSLGAIFSISLFIFMLFTVYQLAVNKTTIETYESQRTRTGSRRANPFDLGYWNNCKYVMGNNIMEWVLPIPKSGKKDLYNLGVCFPLNRPINNDTEMIARLSGEFSRM